MQPSALSPCDRRAEARGALMQLCVLGKQLSGCRWIILFSWLHFEGAVNVWQSLCWLKPPGALRRLILCIVFPHETAQKCPLYTEQTSVSPRPRLMCQILVRCFNANIITIKGTVTIQGSNIEFGSLWWRSSWIGPFRGFISKSVKLLQVWTITYFKLFTVHAVISLLNIFEFHYFLQTSFN